MAGTEALGRVLDEVNGVQQGRRTKLLLSAAAAIVLLITAPVVVWKVSSGGNDGQVATDGVYSVHNAVIEGDLEYASWYSDGVRVVDLSDPRQPRDVAWFVPPPTPPRQTAATAQSGRRDMPVVWGVFPWKGMVLASDMNSGLWVFRVTGGAAANGKAAPAPSAAPTTIPAPVPARDDDPSEPPAGARTTRVSSILTPPLPGK